MVEVARTAEDLGYHSVWTFQRLAYPADPASSAQPGQWPSVYRSVHDPLVTLAFLAAHTSRVRLGVAVVNMPWYSPLLLAKMATTLDAVSDGRLDLGLGLGWASEEYAATGAPSTDRGPRAEEFVQALTAIWTQDQVDVAGRYHELHGVRVDPKPVQRPHPPVLLGGGADAALRRAGRLSDGWISGSAAELSSIGHSIAVVAEGARDADRDPTALRHVCRAVVRVRPAGAVDRRPMSGSYDEIRADLAMLAAHGATEAFVDLNFDSRVGSPDVDPAASMRHAHEVLEALAP